MSIVFIGVPGAGKTTVGRALAEKLGKGFVDVDQRIEEVLGKPIAEVFVDEGEPYFRRMEEEATLELLGTTEVLSLGGGAIMNERIREALQGHDVVWLQVSIGQGSRRVGLNTVRPLMLGNVRGKLIELTRERTPYYQQAATHVVDTDGREPEEIAEELAQVFKQ